MFLCKNGKKMYTQASLDIQLKVPLLKIILYVFIILNLFLIVGDLYNHVSLMRTASHLLMLLVMISTQVGVCRGKYTQVSNSFFTFFEVGMFLLQITRPYTGPESISVFAIILGSFLAFSSVFISSKKVLFTLCIGYVVSFIGFVAFIALPGSKALGIPLVMQNVYFSFIGVISLSLAMIAFRIIFDRVMNTTLNTLREAEERAAWAKNLAITSSHQMGKAKDLLSDANETAEASQDIEGNTKEIDNRFKTLYQRLDNAVEALGSVEKSAGMMTLLANDQSSQVDESGAAVEEMVASIKNVASVIANRAEGVRGLNDKAASGAQVVDSAQEAFEKVRHLVEGIQDLAVLISDIAERTNLLAMNASIQAAHAGEAGKGFAVVAGEVRTLSESTSQSAASIASSIGELVKAINEAGGTVVSTKSAFTDISAGIEHFTGAIEEIGRNVSELDSGSKEILNATSSLRHITSRVDEQSREVSSAQVSIKDAIEGISGLASEMVEETHEISQGASRISSSMTEIQGLARDLETQSRSLNQEIDG